MGKSTISFLSLYKVDNFFLNISLDFFIFLDANKTLDKSKTDPPPIPKIISDLILRIIFSILGIL